MNSTHKGLNFFEITFSVPAQKFGISCSISTEEALPVVTEFALRVTHACGAISRLQLQEFFGFTSMEIDAVIHTLVAERLLVWVEDSLELTPYATARFIDSSDNIPRFFKIKDYDVDLVFDLMSFQPKDTRERANRVNTAMELIPKNIERESRTKVEAERSFQEHFHEIYKGGRAEIYKISDVDPGDRYYIPLDCTFSIDIEDGIQVDRTLSDVTFDNRLEISSAISKVLSVSEGTENPEIAKFQLSFKDPFLAPYLSGETLDFPRYVQNVHLQPTLRNSNTLIPVIGCLHLAETRSQIAALLKEAHESDSEKAYWLAPQTRYWSRSRAISSLTRTITSFIRKSAPSVDSRGEQMMDTPIG
jgi:hypothetical protein